jgi:hypothetical protein
MRLVKQGGRPEAIVPPRTHASLKRIVPHALDAFTEINPQYQGV